MKPEIRNQLMKWKKSRRRLMALVEINSPGIQGRVTLRDIRIVDVDKDAVVTDPLRLSGFVAYIAPHMIGLRFSDGTLMVLCDRERRK